MAELYFYDVVLALAGVVATVTRGRQLETRLGAGSQSTSKFPSWSCDIPYTVTKLLAPLSAPRSLLCDCVTQVHLKKGGDDDTMISGLAEITVGSIPSCKFGKALSISAG